MISQALTICMLLAGVGPDTLLWDNNLETDGQHARAISPPQLPDIRVVDDIVVAGAGWVITGFNYSGVEDRDWVHSGTTEIYVYSDDAGRPGELLATAVGPHKRIDTGRQLFQRQNYEYFVSGIEIPLDSGFYWIGARDPGGSGEGTNFWLTSDGGPSGGCDPEYPNGSCTTGWVSVDGGNEWFAEGPGWLHAFEVLGCPLCPTDIDGSGSIDFDDLLAVLAAWGSYDPCPPFRSEDIDRNCAVDFDDLLLVLSSWGACR